MPDRTQKRWIAAKWFIPRHLKGDKIKVPVSELTGEELVRIIRMAHPNEKGYPYGRNQITEEIDRRGEQLLSEIGWPTAPDSKYHASFTGTEYELKDLLRSERMFAVVENHDPTVGLNVPKHRRYQEALSEINKWISTHPKTNVYTWRDRPDDTLIPYEIKGYYDLHDDKPTPQFIRESIEKEIVRLENEAGISASLTDEATKTEPAAAEGKAKPTPELPFDKLTRSGEKIVEKRKTKQGKTNFVKNDSNEIPEPISSGERGTENPEDQRLEEVSRRLKEGIGQSEGTGKADQKDAEARIALQYAKEANLWIPDIYSLMLTGNYLEDTISLHKELSLD